MRDPFERALYAKALENAIEARENMDDRHAVQIINRLAESMSGKGGNGR